MANWSLALVVSILLAIQGFSASQTTGVCSRPLSRRTSREQSYTTTQYTYYTYYTSCGFLWLGRCRRTGVRSTPRTAYRRVYETEHYSENYCCSGYSGSPPNCQRVCPALYSPSNGRVSVSSFYVNSQASYSCNSGYGVSGSSSRTCQSSGTWSGTQPSCQRVCPDLSQPSGGYVSVDSHFIGGRAHYYCNSGYRLDGSSQRTCVSQWSSPTWSPREPRCIRVCPSLSQPKNGQVSVTTYDVGGTATYICSHGYRMSGSSSLTCSSNGQWDAPQPTCEAVCPHPGQLTNGHVTVERDPIFAGVVLSFRCNPGYRLSGSSNRTCLRSGDWTGTQPSCIRVCDDLTPPKNGIVVVTSRDVGDKATYSCNVGYGMVGSSKRTCILTGEWSGTEPQCQMTCPILTHPNYGHIVVSNYSDGGVATYVCRHGHQIYGNSHQRICKQSNWTGSDIICEAVTCPKLQPPNGGNVVVTNHFPGGTATYTCKSGYHLVGEEDRYCTSDGVWSSSQPTCHLQTMVFSPVRSSCSSSRYGFIAGGRIEVAQSIIEDLEVEAHFQVEESHEESHEDSHASAIAFNLLTNHSNPKIEVSEWNFYRFTEAITEIGVAVQDACSGDAIPTNADIQPISRKFTDEFSTNKDMTTIRSLYGQMLCIKKQDAKRRKRESSTSEECECPPGGIENSIKTCQFFKCIDIEQRKTIFGLGNISYPCLAFVVDTTGSMRDEINDAKNIILQFIGAEEDIGGDGCYLLVPFNDVGPDHANVANKSVGPAAFTFVDNVNDLIMFYNNITSLNAIENSGGDVPEYTLDAIQYALDFRFPDKEPIWPGSQVIVLTDAPTKNAYLNTSIIEKAWDMSVCVHFFLSHPDSLKDGVYEKIADETSGTLDYAYSSLELARFISLYEDNPCDNILAERKKRATSPPSKCKNFHVSRLASSVKFAGETDSASNVTLTSPSQNLTEIVPFGKAAIYRLSNPEPGEWMACVESGSLEVSVVEDVKIDTTILYNNGQSNGSITPPTECSIGEIVLLTSKAELCRTVDLQLFDRDRRGEPVKTIPMSAGCEGDQAFTGSATFPKGAYTYQITGTDTMGIPFQHRIKNSMVRFKTGRYSLKFSDTGSMIPRDAININRTLYISNENEYSSTFKLSARAPGLTLGVYPSEVTVPPKDSLSVVLALPILSSSPLADPSRNLTIRADNDCTRLTASQPIAFEQPIMAPTPSTIDCGCLNGGRCREQVRRGRVTRRCLCPQGYRGVKCQVEI